MHVLLRACQAYTSKNERPEPESARSKQSKSAISSFDNFNQITHSSIKYSLEHTLEKPSNEAKIRSEIDTILFLLLLSIFKNKSLLE
jgi:hypothetical protein